MFQLIGYMETFTAGGQTSHAVKRSHRLQIAERLIIEESAKVVKIAVVNKGHKNGNEIHLVYNNGIVKIYNANSIIKYFSMIENNTNTIISNINMIARLPISGNKTI